MITKKDLRIKIVSSFLMLLTLSASVFVYDKLVEKKDEQYAYQETHLAEMNTGKITGIPKIIEKVKYKNQEDATNSIVYLPDFQREGWLHYDNNWRYRRDGVQLKDCFAYIDGYEYYFDENGIMQTGITTIDDTIYCFTDIGPILRNGIYNNTYHTDENGRVLTGYQWTGTEQLFFSDDGILLANGTTPDGLYNTNSDGVIISANITEASGDCPLRNSPGTSGYRIGGYPLELYMISIAGETSGGAIINGDKGRAYGLCQFDYRYDLMNFINYAYSTHPELWYGLESIVGKYANGNIDLVNNETIENGFRLASQLNPTAYAYDQFSFLYNRYYSDSYKRMNAAGYNLAGRHISVSAAIMSININCGTQTSLYLSKLSPEMTDEELINGLYSIRNGTLTRNRKGTNTRFTTSEPRLAKEMLFGDVTVMSRFTYSGGVAWSGQLLAYCGETGSASFAIAGRMIARLPDDEVIDETSIDDIDSTQSIETITETESTTVESSSVIEETDDITLVPDGDAEVIQPDDETRKVSNVIVAGRQK